MAPSNTTRPRTGSLSLRHSSTVRNYYSTTNNNTAAVANAKANTAINRGGPKTTTTTSTSSGIERSFNSITDTIKGKLSSLDASLDSRRGSLNSSSIGGSMSRSSRSSMDNSSRGNSTATSETTSSSSRYQQHDGGGEVCSIPSFSSTGVESVQSNKLKIYKKTESQRRNSLREIKAALRQEKLHNALSYDDTVTTTTTNENGRRRMMDRGGMESVPSYYQSSSGVPSFESNEEEVGSMLGGVLENMRGDAAENGGGSGSSSTVYSSDERCQLDELWNQETRMEHGGELDAVQEAAVGGGGGVGRNSGQLMIVNQRSCESLDTFRKDTSTNNSNTTSNNNNSKYDSHTSTTNNNSYNNKRTSSRGSAGLYSANLTTKKKTSSTSNSNNNNKAVGKKMSQASFGKIRDILSGGEGHAAHHDTGGAVAGAAGGGRSGAHRVSTSNSNPGGNNNATTTTLMGGYRESGIGLGGILQFGGRTNNNADEEMSFFVSDNDGKVHREHHPGGGNNNAATTTTLIGGKRDSGIGLGGILQFGGRGTNNSADEEMSFFVSDTNGKVHKEKVPLVNKEDDGEEIMMAGGEKKKKMLLLEQDKFHLGETMKVTNVSRRGEELKTKPTVSFQQQQQQQQQRSVFHTKREGETKMSTAPQSPIHDPASGHTPPIVRSVKKASRAVSHSMKHEVVPATKAMAALTAKFVERGEKKMVDNVAPKLRAVALDIDSRLHHHHPRQAEQFVGLQHIEGKGDYVCDPDYQVVPTPQNADQMGGRRAYGPNAVHNFDPNTPACLLGALTAGTMFNYDITHPEHPEYLPEGIPRMLDVPGDWEERAGFVPATALVERKSVGPVDLDEEIEEDESVVGVKEMLALQQAVTTNHHVNEVAKEEETEEEVTDEEDARNASMWVAYNPEEDMEEEDEIMNVGEIIIATGGEFGGEDNEFSPRSLETGDSNTYHLGDLSLGIKSDDADEQKETAIVTFQQDQEVHVETFEDDNAESEDEAGHSHPVEEHYAATPMKKVTYENEETPSQQQQQQFTDKKKEFQTPFSVKKGERPLTFDEFRAMNRRVLFDNEEQAQPTQAMMNVDIGRNTEIEGQPQRQMTVEKFVSASSSRYEQSGDSKRELKGRVVMIRIKKKISKAVKKAMKSILLTAKIGGTKKSSNTSISDTNFVITIPSVEASAMPDSPSAVSIASSLLSAAITESSKRVIGAAPFSTNINAAPDYLYGAVNYHNRSSEDGSVDESEQLPPPPRMTSNQTSDHDDEDVVSFLAEAMNQGMNIDEVLAIEDGKEAADEEEQMYLVLTPSEGGDEKVTQVISGKVDGTPVIFNEIMHKNEEGSEIKPHNLSIMFDSGKKESNNKSMILDAVEVGGNIVLTPTESNQNVGNVFRRTFTGEASASVLQSSTFESSEDETLVTHDGNTLVRLDTKDSHDHTITTTTSMRKEEEKKPLSTFELAREDDPKDVGNSPIRPAYSRQAASNASFLFSPDNMGRADPNIRAKERAMMRNQSHGGSITMLPSASSTDKSEQQLALKPKPSYSFDYSAGGDSKYDAAPSIASGASSQEPDTPSTVATAVQKKHVMASMTKDRQFSFKTILNQFSTDALDSNEHVPRVVEQKFVASPERDFGSSESQSKTPLVTNAVRKKYAAAPFTKAEGSTPSSDSISPSSSSISSKSRRLSSPKGKTLPKSAAKTRTGLVKDRISMFQQRVDAPSAVTGVNGRLKRNHSYRLKNERRETNGGGALAPRKAVLKSSAFIRTVPIGISTSYSRDDAGFAESMNKADACVEQTCTQNDSFREDDDSIEKPNSYVKQYMNTSKVNEEAEPFGRGSLDSSTCVSEATEFDAFNSLLGKFDDDDSSVESESSEETLVTDKQKENVSMSPNVLPSTSQFKQGTLVKPNEISHNRTPLTAQKWRSLAATHGKSSRKLVMKY